MIGRIGLKNFKSFRNAELDINWLTLLTGLNSSGKSSVLQAIRMWARCSPLEGHGRLSQLRSHISEDDYFMISVDDDGVTSHVLHRGDESKLMCACGDFVDDVEAVLQSAEMCEGRNPLSCELHYISAARLGPQTSLAVRPDSVGNSVGEFGEEVLEYLMHRSALAGVPGGMRAPEMENIGSFASNVSAWLGVVAPGASYTTQSLELADAGTISYYADRRPANVGFGLSYTLPIIALLVGESVELSGERTPVVLVENPEAHLHPKGQTALGGLLARAADVGVQCIVETHSEHVLNGIRLAIKNGHLSSDEFICHYFEYKHGEECSSVESVYVDENGGVDYWPDGFFDELEKNLLMLV